MSPTFKEMAAKDVGTVFFNNDEFSDMHLIDGKKMPVSYTHLRAHETRV